MNREEAIQEISALFPVDSDFADTAQKGKELLARAIGREWRALPDSILFRYAELCLAEERRQANGGAA